MKSALELTAATSSSILGAGLRVAWVVWARRWAPLGSPQSQCGLFLRSNAAQARTQGQIQVMQLALLLAWSGATGRITCKPY
jgi:hypothetical protein